MSEIYSINDLEKYAKSIRKNAALSFTEHYDEDLDSYISVKQVENLIVANSIGTDEDDYLLIDEDSYNKTFDEVRTWLYNVGLAKLAAENQVECAWDDNINEMVFWIPSSELTLETENNESKLKRKSTKTNNKPKNKS